MFQENGYKKQACVVIVIYNKIDIKQEIIRRDKERYDILLKR